MICFAGLFVGFLQAQIKAKRVLPAIMSKFKKHHSKAMALTAYRLSGATGIHKGDREYQQDQLVLLTHGQVKLLKQAEHAK